jgi:two-component system, NarL family, response regulator YdfI
VTRVLITANSVMVRAGLEAIVATHSTFTIVGAVPISQLSDQVVNLQPDVVLLEWDFEDDLTAVLPWLEGDPPAVVLIVEEMPGEWVSESLRSQVRGILPTAAIASEIVAAIAAVAAGLTVLHPVAIEALLPTLPAATQPMPVLNQPLTPREVEVLTMLAEGLANKAIARRLQISEHTVKFHVGSIFSKLSVSSRTEAVTVGARQGLILL